MSRKIAFKTLGCRLNQFETDSLVSEFHNAGYRVVDFDQEADVYIVNTCTVTSQSDKKSRNLISQATRKDKDAVVVVTGCMVNSQKDQLQKYRGVTYLIENNRKSSIFSLVEAHFNREIVHPEKYPPDQFNFKPADSTLHTRSLIKIQDGCNNYCTFCIVPFVRGRPASRPVRDILDNIQKVVNFGFKEIILTGVNIGRYTYGNTNFEGLIGKILNIPGDFRVRVSSMEPEGFGDKFIDQFAHPKLMPHLHLSLQSGSDTILLKMRRMYSLKDFTGIIDKIKNRYDDFNFTTDIIVGFPGETDDDFLATCNIVREIGFSHIHTFKFSKRKGTHAEVMDDQIPEIIKKRRSETIRKISVENKRKYRSLLVGKTQMVLVEKVKGNTGWGYGELYVPVEFDHPEMQENMLQRVRLTKLGEGDDPVLEG